MEEQAQPAPQIPQPDVTPDAPAQEQPQEAPQAQPEVQPAAQPEVQAEQPPAEVPAEPQPEQAVPQVQQTQEVDDYSTGIPTFDQQLWQQSQQAQQAQQAQAAVPQQPVPQGPAQSIPQLNVSDFTDQYGNVDMQKFTTAMAARDAQIADTVTRTAVEQATRYAAQLADQRFVEAKQEERLWEQAFKKYPDLQDNKELRDTVHNYRMGTAGTGSPLTPLRAAERIMKYVSAAQQEGVKAATESVKIQAAAHLEDANVTPPNQGTVQKSELVARVGSTDRKEARNARENLVKEWIKDGTIQLPT